MLTVLLALIAPAAEDSRLLFETSPGARVEVLPTHAPEWFELAVLDNRVGLHEQLPRSARFVKDIETVGVGAGTTYIRIQAERDDLRLTAEKVPKGVRLVLEVADGPREIEPVFEPAPYEQIVGDSPPPRRVRNPADVPIRPFTGDARTYRYVPDEVPFGLDDWSGVGDEKLPAQLQVPPTTWEAADGFREVLTGPSGRGDRRAAELLLAQVYLAKGIPHEAAYYLRDVVGKPGPWEPALPHLQLARAEIGRGNLDAAEAQCREAAKAGGDELVVLRCLGAVALQTGHPAPRHLALAIEQRATSGKALLLAAELM
ncbi:MAG: hypothetical protein KC656_33440, partial [Myxococcales bacterium]|nr:hypothetical protein [Myxococcales bacterium]